jgi:predicted dehydrogenase
MHRRTFLKQSGSAAIGLAAAGTRLFAQDIDRPIRTALIGTGWYGKTDLFHLIQVAPVEVVGLCDVDQKLAAQAATLVASRQASKKKPPIYGDYRQLLKDQAPEVVLVGTPDHWHCLPVVEACKAGADVYVQKPISYDVVEGQAMVAAARKYGRTVQVGLERRSTPHLLEARDRYLLSGVMGKIGYIDIHSYYGSHRGFKPAEAPPAHLDWEQYVGPASWVNYHPDLHPRSWRHRREFSNGQTGDLCVHFFDLIRYFMGLGWPRRIASTGGSYMRPQDTNVNVHDTQNTLFDYDDLQVVWTQKNWGASPDKDYPWGATIYGERGTLKLSVWRYDYIPKDGGEVIRRDCVEEREAYPEDLAHKETEIFAAPGNRAQLLDFIQARAEGRRPVADIEEGHISSAACILANLSMELGRELRWDAQTQQVIGDDEANSRLARAYRGDWVHPTPANI